MATTTIDKAGRVVIPAEIRRDLGLTEGKELIIKANGGEVRIYTREMALQRAQEYCKRLKTDRSIVDELIEDRKAEAKREYGG
jgi:AbrB family looped-hinge helix DNA binding protein